MVRFVRVCLAAVLMCHPQVIRSRQRMRHDGGHTLPYQGNCEGLRALPLKSMECVLFCSDSGISQIPVDSFSKPPGDGRMAMQTRIMIFPFALSTLHILNFK